MKKSVSKFGSEECIMIDIEKHQIRSDLRSGMIRMYTSILPAPLLGL